MSRVVVVVEEVDESVDEAPMGTDDGASIESGRAAAYPAPPATPTAAPSTATLAIERRRDGRWMRCERRAM
jgi:hypothetical protein